MDAPMATLTKHDGIVSLQHCQERNNIQNFFLKHLTMLTGKIFEFNARSSILTVGLNRYFLGTTTRRYFQNIASDVTDGSQKIEFYVELEYQSNCILLRF